MLAKVAIWLSVPILTIAVVLLSPMVKASPASDPSIEQTPSLGQSLGSAPPSDFCVGKSDYWHCYLFSRPFQDNVFCQDQKVMYWAECACACIQEPEGYTDWCLEWVYPNCMD